MWKAGALVGMLVVLGACGKGTAPEPNASTRQTAANALGAQTRAVKFTTRGKDKEILVLQFPRSTFEPCDPKALDAMVRMQPDPDLTTERINRESHSVYTGDLAKDTRALKDAFKIEVTPEMKAQMEEVRKLVSQFKRIECETTAGVVVGRPIP